MVTLFIFLIILSVLIFVHEFGHFITARKMGVRVESFSLGFGPQILKKKKGETEYSISLIPLGGYVKMAGDNLEEYTGKSYEYFSKPVGKRFWIIVSGALLNYILGFLCFWFIFFAGCPMLTTKVGGLIEGLGAKKAGIEAGDRIIAIDNQKVGLWDDLIKIIHNKKEADKVSLLIVRNNEEHKIDVLIKERQLDEVIGSSGGKRSSFSGRKQKVGLLGILPDYNDVLVTKHGFFKSFFLALNKTWYLTEATYRGLWMIITGSVSFRDSVTGPLGMFIITSKVATHGIIAILDFLGLISVSLSLFNLLPFPVLDGGHILFLGLEKIRGKTLRPKLEQIITQIGMAMIISFALFVTYNDILRMFGDKIGKFFRV
ncbi:MAG: RIP metalloprotease RseP [Candidatus Omnitrophota bacterium]|nr:RIP metalloprotease RseP [Candidatus Omnitrophota bacterium]